MIQQQQQLYIVAFNDKDLFRNQVDIILQKRQPSDLNRLFNSSNLKQLQIHRICRINRQIMPLIAFSPLFSMPNPQPWMIFFREYRLVWHSAYLIRPLPLQIQTNMSAHISDIKLQTIDFDWIKATTKISHLKRAIAIIEQDGNYYTELKDACYARIEQIDPSAKRIQFNNAVPLELKEAIDSQLTEWENALSHKQTPKQKNETDLEDYEKYFDNETNALTEKKRKERAETERIKGNEAIKSKDFDEAINYYTRSVELDPKMYQAFGNRALAYLKKREFQKCLEDCDKALGINSTYTKAFHRKGKALIELRKKVQAYRCFKEILKLEPQNSEVNQEMMQLREQMSQAEIQQLQSHLIPKSQFKKITIEQDSDEQIQEK